MSGVVGAGRVMVLQDDVYVSLIKIDSFNCEIKDFIETLLFKLFIR